MTKYDHKFPVIKFTYLNCGYGHSLRVLCFAGSENVEFLQLTVVHYINNRFAALVIGCYFCLRS